MIRILGSGLLGFMQIQIKYNLIVIKTKKSTGDSTICTTVLTRQNSFIIIYSSRIISYFSNHNYKEKGKLEKNSVRGVFTVRMQSKWQLFKVRLLRYKSIVFNLVPRLPCRTSCS